MAQHGDRRAEQCAKADALKRNSEHLRAHARRVRQHSRELFEQTKHLVRGFERAARRRRK